MIAKDGIPTISAIAAACAGTLGVGVLTNAIWLVGMGILLLIACLFVVYFFRDPERAPGPGLGVGDILAPADGKVLAVVEEYEDRFMKSSAIRISIFLSPLNVHVNRIPIGGTVQFAEYQPGSFLAAWNPDAGIVNEQSLIGLTTEKGHRILFKQIAGALARRVVFRLKVGDTVQRGARFGIVKFGSRMDVFVPPGSHIHVGEGNRVAAGQTHIATLNVGSNHGS